MAKNPGKKFEENFKKSVPDYCLIHRLRDSSQSYTENNFSRFSWDNECDFFIFDTKARLFYAVEVKSTKDKIMDFELVKPNKKTSKMIKFHQIESLTVFDRFDYVKPCFVLNFRGDTDDVPERCYYISISNFNKMIREIGKKSFNEIDLLKYKAIKISGVKKRVNYVWDIDTLFQKLYEEMEK